MSKAISQATRILFVDDEAKLLSGLRRSLRRYRDSWEIFFANSGAEALGFIAANHIDIVVSDVKMPNLDGAELLTEIANKHPGIIRFVLSGQAEKDAILRLVSVAHQYFAKPFNATTLFEKIQAIRQMQVEINDSQIVAAIHGVRTLACNSQSHDKLGASLELNNLGIDKITEIVRSDPAISAKLMQLVSSSFFGSPKQDCSIDQACQTIGAELLKSLFFDSDAFAKTEKGFPSGHIISTINDALRQQLCLNSADDMERENYSKNRTDWSLAKDYLLLLWGIKRLEHPTRNILLPDSSVQAPQMRGQVR